MSSWIVCRAVRARRATRAKRATAVTISYPRPRYLSSCGNTHTTVLSVVVLSFFFFFSFQPPKLFSSDDDNDDDDERFNRSLLRALKAINTPALCNQLNSHPTTGILFLFFSHMSLNTRKPFNTRRREGKKGQQWWAVSVHNTHWMQRRPSVVLRRVNNVF